MAQQLGTWNGSRGPKFGSQHLCLVTLVSGESPALLWPILEHTLYAQPQTQTRLQSHNKNNFLIQTLIKNHYQ